MVLIGGTPSSTWRLGRGLGGALFASAIFRGFAGFVPGARYRRECRIDVRSCYETYKNERCAPKHHQASHAVTPVLPLVGTDFCFVYPRVVVGVFRHDGVIVHLVVIDAVLLQNQVISIHVCLKRWHIVRGDVLKFAPNFIDLQAAPMHLLGF